MLPPELREIAAAHPYPLVFASLSGAHLYGFPSPDSDFDLRGVHVLPVREVGGLRRGRETVSRQGDDRGLDLDLVTHDAAKFFRLLLRPNGYVLEQLVSPLVVVTTPAHEELRALVPALVTSAHAGHYLGFAATEVRLLEKEPAPRVKPLLYLYRVLLTGIHLMETGEVEPNLLRLLERRPQPGVAELVARKRAGAEAEPLPPADLAFHRAAADRLRESLAAAELSSRLPAAPSAARALDSLLLRLRGV